MSTTDDSATIREPTEIVQELLIRGIRVWEEKKVNKALRCFRRAHELNPEDPRIASHLGLMLVSTGIYQRGFQLCRVALRKKPSNADLLFNLGQAYLLASRRNEARLTFLRGAKVCEDKHRFMDALIKMGIRRKPLIRFLSRENFLNHWLGKISYRNPNVISSGEKVE